MHNFLGQWTALPEPVSLVGVISSCIDESLVVIERGVDLLCWWAKSSSKKALKVCQ